MFDTLKLRDCILHDNADDVAFTNYDPGYTPLVQGCEIGDGDFAGVNGNFAADPLFVDAAAGDWRLRFGSPCVDTAYNAPPTGTLDVAGRPRDVDGDLNTSELADRGAHEFRPLEIVGTAQLGTVLQWRLWGPPGNPCTLYWTRSDIASSPSSTPFGDLDLETALVRVFRVTTAGAPTVLQRQIPNVSALVGQTFAFQSLTDNVAAPNGKAYSNAVQITIVP
jgi:hypothetical protein